MPPVNIPWPMSALPGRRPGEGQGDLINAYAVKIGDNVQIRRTPGLVRILELDDHIARTPRGTHVVGNRLFHAWDDELRCIINKVDTPMIGALPGRDRVTMAHNMRDDSPNLVVVTDLGAYLVDLTTNTVSVYPDKTGEPDDSGGVLASHGQPNSVEYFSGYFVFTHPNGYVTASDLQNPNIPGGSYAKTEYAADRLYRAKAMQSVLLLMGDRSIEVWVDVATSPFPFQRQTALDVGLFSTHAVAGGSAEWERGVFFVASDYTVRHMEGLVPKIISNDDVSFDIYKCRHEPEALFTQVYTFEQQAVFSITCMHSEHESWTWEYNTSTGAWHRRDSYGLASWRGTSAVFYEGRWSCQDLMYGRIFEIMQEVFEEDDERLRYRCESGPIKAFPASIRLPAIEIDCTVGLGKTRVPSPFETQPVVMISWSHDGGATWSRPVARSMGEVGRYSQKVQVNNLGRSTHHGTRIRVDIVDPVPATIVGGVSVAAKPSRARQVD